MDVPSSTETGIPCPSSRETESSIRCSEETSKTTGPFDETSVEIEKFQEDTVTTSRQMEIRADIQRLENIRPLIQEICEVSSSSGLSLGVLHEGQVLYRDNFGHRDVESREPPNSDTFYNINSMTKAVTAAATGVLVEEGLTQWNKPVRELLPAFGDGHGEIGKMINL